MLLKLCETHLYKPEANFKGHKNFAALWISIIYIFFGPYWIVQKIMLLEIMSVKWSLYRSTGERCHIYLNTRLLWRHGVHDFTRSVQSHASRCSNLKCSGKPYYYFIGIVRSKGNASTDAQESILKDLKERLSRAKSMYFSYM